MEPGRLPFLSPNRGMADTRWIMEFQAMTRECKVTFEPSGRSVFVLEGTILLEAAARAGQIIETPCGGAGKCGKCMVRVTSGACDSCDEEHTVLGADRIRRGYRLACRCRVKRDLVVEIPETSLFQSSQKILATDAGGHLDVRPAVRKQCVRVTPPTREDVRSDSERLNEALGGGLRIGIHALQALPLALRQHDFTVTAARVGDHVIDVEPGDTTGRCYGLAFDIGSTTLVGTLINLCDGRELGVVSRVNPQTAFGDDVVSRIRRCRDEADGLERLHMAIRDAVNDMIDDLAKRAGIATDDIWEAVLAGNSTMQEILCNIHPFALGEIPFVPVFRERVRMRASDLGLRIHPAGEVSVFPQIGGFVGGDTVAGIIATRLNDMREGPVLLVDVGTNGEIVLAHEGRMVATSVAAGPAFEGARIINGMRATTGAIEKVVIDGDVEMNVIGNAKPAGICGTGLIDAVAYLLRRGIVDETGRILGPDELPAGLPDALLRRLVARNDQYDFLLAGPDETGTNEAVYLHQRDIRELQLANAAIRAGIMILLRHAGVEASALHAILLAGGFGNFIRRNNARRIGMLPPIDTARIRFVGNTSSLGAKRALLAADEWTRAEQVVRETRHVDLSLDPEFQEEFSMAMMFPGPEVES